MPIKWKLTAKGSIINNLLSGSYTKKAFDDIGYAIVENAQDYVPVDTGDLRDSITYEAEEQCVRVGSALEYAPYVELGTGPNYKRPPKWMTNNAQRGYHDTDPWLYYDEDEGEWKLGWFVTSRPYLKPAFLDHADEYKGLMKDNLPWFMD